MNSPRELADLLTSCQLRVSTGIWLIPTSYIGKEQEEGHRLQLEPVDLRARLLQSLEPGSKVSDLSPDKIFNLIDQVSQEYNDWSGALVYNLDLLLSRLKSTNRSIVWQDLFSALPHRRRGVLLVMPETAAQLLPSEEDLAFWRLENRLVGTVQK